MSRWGITLPLGGLPLAEHEDVIAELAELGYTDAWSAESNGADGFVPLALASQWAPGLRLGTAIVPVFTRGPALLAMSAATLADAAPGRFVLGIGASSPAVVGRWNATEFTRPLARTRDTLRFVKRALTGEKVDERFDTFTVRGFRLDRVPAAPPPVMLAALRPAMLALAAAEADGAITNWLAPGDVPRIREVTGPDIELVARVFVCPTEDARSARTMARRLIAGYLTVPAYAKFHEWLGRGPALAPLQRLWAAGDRKAAAASIPDEVVDDLVVHGDPDTCRARIREYLTAGLDTAILAVLPVGDPRETARALAPGGPAGG